VRVCYANVEIVLEHSIGLLVADSSWRYPRVTLFRAENAFRTYRSPRGGPGASFP
jgi:hypothetical protein